MSVSISTCKHVGTDLLMYISIYLHLPIYAFIETSIAKTMNLFTTKYKKGKKRKLPYVKPQWITKLQKLYGHS